MQINKNEEQEIQEDYDEQFDLEDVINKNIQKQLNKLKEEKVESDIEKNANSDEEDKNNKDLNKNIKSLKEKRDELLLIKDEQGTFFPFDR